MSPPPPLPLPPLRFRPIFKEKVWGGRKLKRFLEKNIPDARRVGESWELSDHPSAESVVLGGPFDGATLGQIVRQRRDDLLGRSGARAFPDRFPLLFKFVDASDVLSVQVHPTRAYAERHDLAEREKSEAWFVVQADPGARVYRGWAPGTTEPAARRALAEGKIEPLLHSFPVKAGDVIALPAGTVHAIGAGVLLAEIQQTSDATFRLYDWNRPDLDGRMRPLHVEEALAVADFTPSPDTVTPAPLPGFSYDRQRLLAAPEFTVESLRFTGLIYEPPPPGDREEFAILVALSGSGSLLWKCEGERQTEFRPGDVLLLPAILREFNLFAEEEARVLKITPPRLLVATAASDPIGGGGAVEPGGG
ncbi:MAG: class I mannose-6-phosphate isomerase [Planctomycetes bacterium]|nr:class I mannose-6-phosphate isomerase [Planctomycetota bacterium]